MGCAVLQLAAGMAREQSVQPRRLFHAPFSRPLPLQLFGFGNLWDERVYLALLEGPYTKSTVYVLTCALSGGGGRSLPIGSTFSRRVPLTLRPNQAPDPPLL